MRIFLFEALAHGVGFRLYLELRKSRGDVLDTPRRWWVVAAATAGALVGAPLLAILDNPARLRTECCEPPVLLAGKTIVGALWGIMRGGMDEAGAGNQTEDWGSA